MRTIVGAFLGLVTPAALNIVAGWALGYRPSPMFWTTLQTVGQIAVLFVGAVLGAVAAVRLSGRTAIAPVASIAGLVYGYDALEVGAPAWVVTLTALSGVSGALVSLWAKRYQTRPRDGVAA